MIVSFLIQIANIALSGLLAILPSSTGLPSGISSSLHNVAYYMNALSYIIPVSDLLSALGIVLGFEFAIWGFRGFMWIWHKVPFLGR